MRKQDEPFFDQDGSILMNHEGKKAAHGGHGGHGVVEGVSRICGRSISKGMFVFHSDLFCRTSGFTPYACG
jgi:hypothetical protein